MLRRGVDAMPHLHAISPGYSACHVRKPLRLIPYSRPRREQRPHDGRLNLVGGDLQRCRSIVCSWSVHVSTLVEQHSTISACPFLTQHAAVSFLRPRWRGLDLPRARGASPRLSRDCPSCEAKYNAVVPSSVPGWFTSAPLLSSISTTSTYPSADATYSGLDPTSEVARSAFTPCARSFSTTFACPS